MNKEFSRAERVASLIQVELARLIQEEIDEVRFYLITVTKVKISADLACAKIYFVSHKEQEEDVKRQLKLLNNAAKFLRRQLASRMRMRKIPELRFYYDISIARGSRISKLLNDTMDDNN
jgi:ribosome-binding factor A